MGNTIENKTKDKTTQRFRKVDPSEVSLFSKIILILNLPKMGKGGESYGM